MLHQHREDPPVPRPDEVVRNGDDRERLATYGYSTLRRLIRAQRIYDQCRGVQPPIAPTSDDLEVLRRSSDERHVLAGETLLTALADWDKIWSTWDRDKGASRETYFVRAMILRFPRAFEKWQAGRRHQPLARGLRDLAPTGPAARATWTDPALDAIARDTLHRVVRTAGPELRTMLALVVEGYPHSAIADRLRISARAVEGRLHRFRKQLRSSALSPYGSDDPMDSGAGHFGGR
ncbi:RNA polymerase sigma factor [Streptomyces sp. NPDC029674]|uniref:RNA polymerase sigma factor n=1 Tax=Streptomyces sp. NPDC029674 TaxID=3365297 RepID=UPI00384CB277